MVRGDKAPGEGWFIARQDFISLAKRIQDIEAANVALNTAYEAQERALKASIANTEMWKAEATKGRSVGSYALQWGGAAALCAGSSYFVSKSVQDNNLQ